MKCRKRNEGPDRQSIPEPPQSQFMKPALTIELPGQFLWMKHQLQYRTPATRSATPTATPTPLTLTRTTSKAAATLTSEPSEPLHCCHHFVRVRHRVSTTTPHPPRIDIVRPLPVCRSTEDDDEVPPRLHVVGPKYVQPPIHIRLALCTHPPHP